MQLSPFYDCKKLNSLEIFRYLNAGWPKISILLWNFLCREIDMHMRVRVVSSQLYSCLFEEFGRIVVTAVENEITAIRCSIDTYTL